MIGDNRPITASRDAVGTILINGGARQIQRGISGAVAAAAEPGSLHARAEIGADHAERKDTMIKTSRLWTFLTQINAAEGSRSSFDGQIAAVGARISNGRRARLLSAVAFRLWAAASVCLATDGATGTERTTLLPQICAAADLRLTMLIEARGEAQDVAPEILAHAFLAVLEARKACNEGQVEAAIKLYESIPLGAGMSRRQ